MTANFVYFLLNMSELLIINKLLKPYNILDMFKNLDNRLVKLEKHVLQKVVKMLILKNNGEPFVENKK